ncbi:MAG: SUMF1/EgtB/PvdO family nonheme iron enzyme [Deltaproteobacteria bacterium]|nr:SUMF1/EgtB/PvdO family nonheme iron enzyme [Deltaproteobacteria bacterium]
MKKGHNAGRGGIRKKTSPITRQSFHEKGEKIAERYEVIDVIGSGGLGVVYRVRDLEIDVDVALKYFDPSLFPDSASLDRFGKSVRAIRRFSQPNIVRIYDVEQIGRSYYVTMQLLEGLSLRQIIDLRQGKGQLFSIPEIEPIISQVSLALQHAHQYTFHGNLKPDNIIVLPDLLKVTDFCLDRAIHHEAYLNAQAESGTLDYLSPEQKHIAARADRRTDIYSLGIMIGEMLAGRIFKGIPFKLSKFNDQIPPALDYVFLRSVHPVPSVRYPAVEDLAEDLLEILEKGDLTYAYSLDDLSMPQSRPSPSPPPIPGKSEDKQLAAGKRKAAEKKKKTLKQKKKAEHTEHSDDVKSKQPKEAAPVIEKPSTGPTTSDKVSDIDDSAWDDVELEAVPASKAKETPVFMKDSQVPAQKNIDEQIHEEKQVELDEEHPPSKGKEDEFQPVDESNIEEEEFSIDIDMGDDEPEEEESEEGIEEGALPAPPPEDEREAGIRTAEHLGGEETVARIIGAEEDEKYSGTQADELGQELGPDVRDLASGEKAPTSKQEIAEPPALDKSAKTTSPESMGRTNKSILPVLAVIGIIIAMIVGGSLLYLSSGGSNEKPTNYKRNASPIAKERAQKKQTSKTRVLVETSPSKEKPTLEKQETAQAKVIKKPENEKQAQEQAGRNQENEPGQENIIDKRKNVKPVKQAGKPKKGLNNKKFAALKKKRQQQKAAELEKIKRQQQKAAELEKKKRQQQKAAELEKKKRQQQKAAELEKIKKEREAAMAAQPQPGNLTGNIKCPRGMVMIPAGPFLMGSSPGDPMRNFGEKANTKIELPAYCIDYYEYPNGRGLKPRVNVSWYTASKLCARRGKRLCTEEEWEKACKGPGNKKYPYGNRFEPNKCDNEDENGEDRDLSPSGTFRKCRSGYGVFDMSGNASEWTSGLWSSTIKDRVQKGGSADRPDWAVRCASRENHAPSSKGPLAGFRCCADPISK